MLILNQIIYAHTDTHTSELVVSPTEMAWLDGRVSSGFSGATETVIGREGIIIML